MTIEKAIKVFHCPDVYVTEEDSELAHTVSLFSKSYGEAVKMAIESLRSWNDVISVLNKYTQKLDDQDDEFEMGIKRGINIALEEIYKNMPKEEQDAH